MTSASLCVSMHTLVKLLRAEGPILAFVPPSQAATQLNTKNEESAKFTCLDMFFC